MRRTVLFALLILALSALAAAQSDVPAAEPQTPTAWFRRADDLTNLRLPGSAPFHMKVVFHALPGMEFRQPGEPGVLTGDGSYEETWLSPDQWRREITFGDWHAIEVRSHGVRKIQEVSDYEPSRVLMLLTALLNPIPRDLVSPEIESARPKWKLRRVTVGGTELVRLSYTRHSDKLPASTEYDLAPNGLPRSVTVAGLLTSWQNDTLFAGKQVPQVIVVRAGIHTLVAASVAITPASQVDLAQFQLPGPSADPASTLRPLLYYDVVPPSILPSTLSVDSMAITNVTGRAVVDRRGIPHEIEALSPVFPVVGREWTAAIRKQRFRPATIDGVPCEFAATFLPPLRHW